MSLNVVIFPLRRKELGGFQVGQQPSETGSKRAGFKALTGELESVEENEGWKEVSKEERPPITRNFSLSLMQLTII